MDNIRITSKGIKREARGLLANNWSRALGGMAIYLMVLVLFVQVSQLVTALLGDFGPATAADKATLSSFQDYLTYFTTGGMGINLLIMLVMAIFFFVLSAPLSLGITHWYRNLSLLGNLQVGQIFRYYRSNDLFFSAVIFQGISTVLHILIAIVSFLPSVVCFAVAYVQGSSPDGGFPLMLVLGGVLAFAGIFIYLAISLRFFFAKYLFCGDYGYGAIDCLRYSNKYMKKHVGSVMGVMLSFTGWFLSCIFILPIAYVVPLYNASMAACAQDIIDEHMGETIEIHKKRRERYVSE
ncbi:MAG: DUF975 family protein [Ruminococcaceae bacterium]|nr:DUF975 family protein [Oscillospiraceae bacterium]